MLNGESPTDLAGSHDVLVLWVLIHSQAENVISVLQVEALTPWENSNRVLFTTGSQEERPLTRRLFERLVAALSRGRTQVGQ